MGAIFMPGTHGGKRRILCSLETGSQMVMCHHVVLGIEPRSSVRTASALNH